MGECPLCGYKEDDDYALALHVEEQHFAEESPFVIKGDNVVPDPEPNPISDDRSEDPWILCEEAACGEYVLFTDYADHLSFHICENLEIDPDESLEALPNKTPHQRHSRYQVSLGTGDGESNRKLGLSRTISPKGKLGHRGIRFGRGELGPYAWEERMPSWLLRQLENGAKANIIQTIGPDGRLVRHVAVENEVAGIVPVLAQLLDADETVERAYLCHPAVKHVFKTQNEGGFCGYRNIQMMMSYMLGSRHPGMERINRIMKESWRATGRIPNVLDIQRAIENAWTKGFGVNGRLETGGVFETRKYIGTPEVTTMLSSMSISYDSKFFSDTSSTSGSKLAGEYLLQEVLKYFGKFSPRDSNGVIETQHPPIYFQMPGHSLTIVGVEQRKSGETNLLVFDPAFKPSKGMYKLLDKPPPRRSGSESMTSSRSNSIASSHSTNTRQTSLLSSRGGDTSKGTAPIEMYGDKRVLMKAKTSASFGSIFRSRQSIGSSTASKILEPYRRGKAKLKRHAQFEICTLNV